MTTPRSFRTGSSQYDVWVTDDVPWQDAEQALIDAETLSQFRLAMRCKHVNHLLDYWQRDGRMMWWRAKWNRLEASGRKDLGFCEELLERGVIVKYIGNDFPQLWRQRLTYLSCSAHDYNSANLLDTKDDIHTGIPDYDLTVCKQDDGEPDYVFVAPLPVHFEGGYQLHKNT